MQHRVDEAHALEERHPVQRRHQAHAEDHIADGHVHRGLALMLHADDVVGCRPLRLEALVEPEQRRSDGTILIPEPLDELHREGSHERAALESRESLRRPRDRNTVVTHAQKLVREGVRVLARRAPADDGLRQAPEVLHEYDAQRDRHGPQLADRQWLHTLVGVQEPPEELGIESAVGMGDEGPGDSIHARIAGERPLGQLGQLPVEPGRQVVADLAQLFVDDVEVVDEPFRRRSDRALLADGLGDHAIGFAQDAAVVLNARQQSPAPARRHALRGRQARGVLLEPLDAEELGADRVFENQPALHNPFHRTDPHPSRLDQHAEDRAHRALRYAEVATDLRRRHFAMALHEAAKDIRVELAPEID